MANTKARNAANSEALEHLAQAVATIDRLVVILTNRLPSNDPDLMAAQEMSKSMHVYLAENQGN